MIMKQLLTLLLALSFGLSFAQTTLIPDANFEQALIDKGFDAGTLDGSVPTANIDTLTYLDLSFLFNISEALIELETIEPVAKIVISFPSCSWIHLPISNW